MIDALSRRGFLATSTFAAGATAFRVGASPLQPPMLVAVDHRIGGSELRRLVLPTQQPHFILGHDIVRLWRYRLIHVLASGTRIDAYTRWDLSLLLADMAREDRLEVKQAHLARSVLLTHIAGTQSG